MDNRHINTFETTQEFSLSADHLQKPSISYIKDKDRIVVENKYHKATEDKTKAKVGDLVFYNDMIYDDDIQGDQLLYMDPKDSRVKMMIENDMCLGIVVVEAGWIDEKVYVVSLDYMDYNNPGSGSKTPVNMMWGKYNENITSIPAKDKIIAYTPGTSTASLVDYSYFATDYSLIDSKSANLDKSCHYDYLAADNSMVPTPYMYTGLQNSTYFLNSNSVLNAGFNGESNTNAILTWGNIDYENLSTVQNQEANYPAATCCKLYYRGTMSDYELPEYYLPSIAELGMLLARLEEVNFARSIVGYPHLVDTYLWSSSLYSSYGAWTVCLDLSSGFGGCDGSTKNGSLSVLAFVAL